MKMVISVKHRADAIAITHQFARQLIAFIYDAAIHNTPSFACIHIEDKTHYAWKTDLVKTLSFSRQGVQWLDRLRIVYPQCNKATFISTVYSSIHNFITGTGNLPDIRLCLRVPKQKKETLQKLVAFCVAFQCDLRGSNKIYRENHIYGLRELMTPNRIENSVAGPEDVGLYVLLDARKAIQKYIMNRGYIFWMMAQCVDNDCARNIIQRTKYLQSVY